MKRVLDVALTLSTIFGINHIDNDSATHIISYCDAQSKYELHCTSGRFYQLSSYNNLSAILDRNPNALTEKEKEYALLWATQRSHYHTVKRLLENGTSPNADNRLHLSPLTIAQNKDDKPIIELLEKHGCLINPKFISLPPFVIAIYTRDAEMLQKCINDQQYDPEYICDTQCHGDKECNTNMLHLAAHIGDANILTILLAQPNISTKINQISSTSYSYTTPYWIAYGKKYIPFSETLAAHPDMDINIVHKQGHSAIGIATYNGHTNFVKLLTSHKKYMPDIIDAHEATPLYIAASKGYIEIAKLFLDDPRININYLFKGQFTSLYVASLNGDTNMVKLLLTHPRIKEDITGNATPLYCACENGHLDCVKILCLANPNMINIPSKIYYPPIWIAKEQGHLEIVQHLLSYAITDTNCEDAKGRTLLHIRSESNDVEITTLLLQHSPHLLNICTYEGNSLLHMVASEDEMTIAKIVLETKGCDVNILNQENHTPLDLAENNDMKELIIAHGGKYGKDMIS